MEKEKHITLLVKMTGLKPHTNKAKQVKTKWNCLIEGKVPLDIIYDDETKYDTAIFDFIWERVNELLPGNADADTTAKTIHSMSILFDERGYSRRGTTLEDKLETRGIETIDTFELSQEPYKGDGKGFDSWIDLANINDNWISKVSEMDRLTTSVEGKLTMEDYTSFIYGLKNKNFEVKEKDYPIALLEKHKLYSGDVTGYYRRDNVTFYEGVDKIITGTLKGKDFKHALDRYKGRFIDIDNLKYTMLNDIPADTRLIASSDALTIYDHLDEGVINPEKGVDRYSSTSIHNQSKTE